MTEVEPDCTVVFEANFGESNYLSYRAFKFEWEGQAEVPYLVAEADNESALLTFNMLFKKNAIGINISDVILLG